MSAVQFLAHYERIADAPDAIDQLRRFLLDLAVRGQLVPQDTADESAEELMDRIAWRRTATPKGEEKAKTALPDVEDVEAPYALPASWHWVRFGNIAEYAAGRTPSRNDPTYWSNGTHPWVSISDIEDSGIVLSTKELVTEKAAQRIFRSAPQAVGTLIMSFKLTIGKIARLGVPAYHNEAIISIQPYVDGLDEYLFKALPMFARRGDTKGAIKGATLNRKSLSNILIPLPPLAEQQRIVAKVDELMALCDRLEAERAKRETIRDRLAAASLARLSASDTETFRDDARFILDALPALTARPDQIKALRQTILDLAVRGKLVPQDPTEEPASALPRRNGNVEVNTSASPSPQCRLPQGWICTRLGAVANIVMGQSPPGETYNKAGEGVPLINGPVEFSDGPFGFTVINQYTTAPTKFCEEGNLLLCVRGSTTGRTNIAGFRACIGRGVAAIQTHFDDAYVRLFIWKSREEIIAMGRGVAFPSISRKQIEGLVLPLPPLAEQQRIVAKVDELMALCDRLEASLGEVAETRSRLLDALIAEALAPSQGPGAAEVIALAEALV